jgi:hypothetical protein
LRFRGAPEERKAVPAPAVQPGPPLDRVLGGARRQPLAPRA